MRRRDSLSPCTRRCASTKKDCSSALRGNSLGRFARWLSDSRRPDRIHGEEKNLVERNVDDRLVTDLIAACRSVAAKQDLLAPTPSAVRLETPDLGQQKPITLRPPKPQADE